ncbi:MAG: beta-aspartyl-peptidase [Verrucomicrobia bacterium]|jgi:beta-aspartyl-peptidase (threonine type)|nr:beta-aspartyl-peptidase [Verrucomicrobiota bacterium]
MDPDAASPIAVALHGGSGTILRDRLTPEKERAYRTALEEAREAAWRLLAEGACALDAVEAGARCLEDCPLFNAGRGSVLTAEGKHELDAAIMEGERHRAGAVAGLSTVRNPVSLARKVMECSPFVFLAGAGAEAFAAQQGADLVDPGWFTTAERLEQLAKARERRCAVIDHDDHESEKTGTIGVVALDSRGNLAAATSTGGLTNKEYGRIGDSPLIGAGTYADNATCAVSCTGYGEEFIRAVVAHDISARMRYRGESLSAATEHVMHVSLAEIDGRGGLVAVDASGFVSLPFNTTGMYRAWRDSSGSEGVAIFQE